MDIKFKENIWKMYLFEFFIGLNFVGSVLVPFFTDWGKINFTQIMILQSWFSFWIFVFEVPTGAIADYFGRKKTLALACLINALAALVYGSKPLFYVFLAGEFLWAISRSLFSGTTEAIVYESLEEVNETKKAKEVFGRLRSFDLTGMLVGAPAGSLIAAKLGLRATILLCSIPSMIAFFISLTLKEPKKEEKQKSYFGTLKEGIKILRKNEALKILTFDLISIASISYFIIWLYQPMLKRAGIAIAYFGIVQAALVIGQILVMNNYTKLEEFLGSKKGLLFFSAVITGAMLILGGLTTYAPLVLLSIILGGSFGLARKPLLISYMNKYIPSSERATVLSAVSMLNRVVLFLVNPFVGMLVDWSLSFTLVILGTLAIFFALTSRVEERHLVM